MAVAEPERLNYRELVSKIQTQSITDDEIARYFVEDRAASKPFMPALKLNEDLVDIAGVERSARASANLLGQDAVRATERSSRRGAFAAAGGAATIVAEGDSWFSLPPIYPDTLIDFLQQVRPIENLAHWGDELETMIATGEYLSYLAREKVAFLLFSGGGNDVLGGGQIYRFLRLFNVGHSDPRDASYYPTPDFYRALDRLEKLFRQLARQVQRVSPQTLLVVHGYDRAVPQSEGIFLGRPMARQGLNALDRPKLCSAIVGFMVDRWNERLSGLAREFDHMRYVDLRGSIGAREWFDELHPRSPGARRLAARFAAVLGVRAPMVAAAKKEPRAAAPRRPAPARKAAARPVRARKAPKRPARKAGRRS